jgi:hypothetical protein
MNPKEKVRFPAPAEARTHRSPGRGPGLLGQFYLALFAQGSLLTHAVYGFEFERRSWLLGVLGALALAAISVCLLRPAIQDWRSALSANERLFLQGFTLLFFFAPAALPSHSVLPEGFVLALPMLLWFAIDPRLARRYMAVCLIGFWFALGNAPGAPLGLVVAFGAASLWAFAGAHFAFVGEMFSLRGWWPLGRILGAVALYTIPSALAAYLAYLTWPGSPDVPALDPSTRPDPSVALLRLTELDPKEMKRFLLHAGFSLGIIVASLIALYFLRRYFGKRARPKDMPRVLGAEISAIEYEARRGSAPRPSLDGTRGQIVRLWARWARYKEAEGIHREPSETAAEWTERLRTEPECGEAAGSLTRLFEEAHYGARNPAAEEVRRMKRLVESETGGKQGRSGESGDGPQEGAETRR